MDIFQIKTDKKLMSQTVEIVGLVVASYPANNGFWLNVQDRTGSIFIFSKLNFRINELLKIRGIVKQDNKGMAYVYSDKVIRAFQPKESMPVKQIAKQEPKEKFKINTKMLIIGLALVIIVFISNFFLYFHSKSKKPEIQSFLESVNKDFTATLDSCLKTKNSEKRDRCLYRVAPYAVENNLTLAIDICKRIEDNSELNRCINFLSMYMAKKDINLSMDICSGMEDISARNNCILTLVPELAKQDMNRTLELCRQFDIVLKDNCFYNIALSQINLEESKVYCENIVNLSVKDSCFNSFRSINETINTTMV